jgi:hypothetical protein
MDFLNSPLSKGANKTPGLSPGMGWGKMFSPMQPLTRL